MARRARRYWSAAVTRRTKHGVFPPGFFLRSASEIAHGVKARSRSYRQAMGRLTFYVNRAGKNLPVGRRRTLEAAKAHLRSLYGRSRYTYSLQG